MKERKRNGIFVEEDRVSRIFSLSLFTIPKASSNLCFKHCKKAFYNEAAAEEMGILNVSKVLFAEWYLFVLLVNSVPKETKCNAILKGLS